MKRSIIIACALAIGSSFGVAEDLSATQGQNTTAASKSSYQPEKMSLFDSSVIENKKITDASGKELGKLERLLIDSKSGQVRFAVVQVDKEWSLNNPEVIVPWRTLQISTTGQNEYALKIDATRDKLMKAPHFDKALVHQLNTREAGQPIYTYWGVTWEDMPGTNASTVSTPAPGTTTSSELSSSAPTSTSPSVTSPAITPSDRATSTPSESTTTTPSAPSDSTPSTPSDGSVGTQPLGNSGTTDSPRPESSLGQPAEDSSEIRDPEFSADESERSLGGNETD